MTELKKVKFRLGLREEKLISLYEGQTKLTAEAARARKQNEHKTVTAAEFEFAATLSERAAKHSKIVRRFKNSYAHHRMRCTQQHPQSARYLVVAVKRWCLRNCAFWS